MKFNEVIGRMIPQVACWWELTEMVDNERKLESIGPEILKT
jgi:hypothetical protein